MRSEGRRAARRIQRELPLTVPRRRQWSGAEPRHPLGTTAPSSVTTLSSRWSSAWSERLDGEAVQRQQPRRALSGSSSGDLADVVRVVEPQLESASSAIGRDLARGDDGLRKRMAQTIEVRVARPARQLVSPGRHVGAIRGLVQVERRLATNVACSPSSNRVSAIRRCS